MRRREEICAEKPLNARQYTIELTMIICSDAFCLVLARWGMLSLFKRSPRQRLEMLRGSGLPEKENSHMGGKNVEAEDVMIWWNQSIFEGI